MRGGGGQGKKERKERVSLICINVYFLNGIIKQIKFGSGIDFKIKVNIFKVVSVNSAL